MPEYSKIELKNIANDLCRITIQNALLDSIKEVLNKDALLDDNIFELGADSLDLAQIIINVEEKTGLNVPDSILEYPKATIRELAKIAGGGDLNEG